MTTLTVYIATERSFHTMEGPLMLMNSKGELREFDGNESEVQQFKDDLRQQLMNAYQDITHVWFEDEVGSIRDPIKGPNPVYGPKALAMRN